MSVHADPFVRRAIPRAVGPLFAACAFAVSAAAAELRGTGDLQRDGPQAREPVDALLRGALAGAGLGYGVVYGAGDARIAAALAAVAAPLGLAPAPVEAAGRPLRLRCRDCLVPGCEHLLFPRRTTP